MGERVLRQLSLTAEQAHVFRKPLVDVAHGSDRPECMRSVYMVCVTICIDAVGYPAIESDTDRRHQAVAQARSCGPLAARAAAGVREGASARKHQPPPSPQFSCLSHSHGAAADG